ncbi:MAG: helix-turn-helix domain-containing protein [Acidimicrobiales bacterium]
MARRSPLPKLAFSTREVAAMLGVSRPTVDRLVAGGILPSVDLGPTRRTLIPAWAIEELIDRPGVETVRGAAAGDDEGSEPRDAA